MLPLTGIRFRRLARLTLRGLVLDDRFCLALAEAFGGGVGASTPDMAACGTRRSSSVKFASVLARGSQMLECLEDTGRRACGVGVRTVLCFEAPV